MRTIQTNGIEISVNERELIALKNLKVGQEKNPHFSGMTTLQNSITKVKSSLYPEQELYLAEAWGDIRVKAFRCLTSVDDKQQPGHHVYFKTADEAVLYHHCLKIILENGVEIMDTIEVNGVTATGQTVGELIDSLETQYFYFTNPHILSSIEDLDTAAKELNRFLEYLRKIKLINKFLEADGEKVPYIEIYVESEENKNNALRIMRRGFGIEIYAADSHFGNFAKSFTLDSITARAYNMLELIENIKKIRNKQAYL